MSEKFPEFFKMGFKAACLMFACLAAGTILIMASNFLVTDSLISNTLNTVSKSNYSKHQIYSKLRAAHHTECVVVTSGMRLGPDRQPPAMNLRRAFVDAVLSPTLGNCEIIASGDLKGYNYFRYWHGSQVVSKVILTFVGVPSLRAIVLITFFGAFAFFLSTVGSRIGWPVAGSLAVVILATPLYSQFLILPHASCWIIAFLAAGHIIRSGVVSLEANILRFMLFGVLVCYFDLLTNPIIVPVSALIAVTIRRWYDHRDADVIEASVLLGAWLIGYAVFWLLKWVLAASVLGADTVIKTVGRIILFRLSGHFGSQDISAWNSIRLNADIMEPTTFVAIGVALLFVLAAKRGKQWSSLVIADGMSRRLAGQLLAMALLPLVWLGVLQNHSIIHAWFVAPILSWTLICLLLAVQILVLSRPEPKNRAAAPRAVSSACAGH